MANMDWLNSSTNYWAAKERGRESGLELTLQGVDEVVGSIKDLDEATAVAALGRLLCVPQHIPCKPHQSAHDTFLIQYSPETGKCHAGLATTTD